MFPVFHEADFLVTKKLTETVVLFQGDEWKVLCQDDEGWRRNDDVKFKHEDTDVYLGMSGNKYGRPINGQKEVCGLSILSTNCLWRAAEGVFIMPTENE